MATTNALRLVGNSLVPNDVSGIAPDELEEWFESLDDVLIRYGPQRLQELLVNLQERAYLRGVTLPFTANTPYVNTIPADEQPRFPGNIEIERRIKSIIRWNAMAMVSRANTKYSGVGGHISTFASSATLYEVGMNHFFHARIGRAHRRLHLFPGARLARHVCAGLRRRAPDRRGPGAFPPRDATARHRGSRPIRIRG